MNITSTLVRSRNEYFQRRTYSCDIQISATACIVSHPLYIIPVQYLGHFPRHNIQSNLHCRNDAQSNNLNLNLHFRHNTPPPLHCGHKASNSFKDYLSPSIREPCCPLFPLCLSPAFLPFPHPLCPSVVSISFWRTSSPLISSLPLLSLSLSLCVAVKANVHARTHARTHTQVHMFLCIPEP